MEGYRPLLIRDVPSSERPRERMMQEGEAYLNVAELLAILLRTGSRDESALSLAHRILQKVEGLRGLIHVSIEELMELKGVGPAKAVQIKAGVELGRRLAQLQPEERYVIRQPQDIADFLMEKLRYQQQEHFVCLFLNTKNQVLAESTIFIGSLNASIVHPREIFREAVKRHAASFACAHNHPSGDPTPSREDIAVTRRLVEAGQLMGIECLDHIIIGDGKYISLKEKGYI